MATNEFNYKAAWERLRRSMENAGEIMDMLPDSMFNADYKKGAKTSYVSVLNVMDAAERGELEV